jgi:hypothetical protein
MIIIISGDVFPNLMMIVIILGTSQIEMQWRVCPHAACVVGVKHSIPRVEFTYQRTR